MSRGGGPKTGREEHPDQLELEDAIAAAAAPEPVAMEAPDIETGEPQAGAPVLATNAGVVVHFPAPPPVINPKGVIFGQCRLWLQHVTGRAEKPMRSLLGRWISQHGEAAVLTVLESASRNPPPTGDYLPWIEKGLRNESARLSSRQGMEAGAAEFMDWSDQFFQGVN